MRSILAATLLLAVFSLSVYADGGEVSKQKKLAPTQTSPIETPQKEGELLSTEADGLDTLGVLPDEIVTENNGGTRRVKLETLVFKRQTPVYYAATDRRDPFRALVVDEKKEGEIKTDLLRMEDAVLTGVVWSDGKYLAMVRDKDGRSFFLREGDAIYSGKVMYVGQTEAIFEVSEFGDYSRITLKVQAPELKQ